VKASEDQDADKILQYSETHTTLQKDIEDYYEQLMALEQDWLQKEQIFL